MAKKFTYGKLAVADYPSDQAAISDYKRYIRQEAYQEREHRELCSTMRLLAEAVNFAEQERARSNRRMVANQHHASYWRAVEEAVAHTPLTQELPDWVLRPSRIGYGFAHANQNSSHVLGSRLDEEGKRFVGNPLPRRLPKQKTQEELKAEFARLVGFDL